MNVVEEWRPVVGLEGRYEVSSDGHVRNSRTDHILKPCGKQYLRVMLPFRRAQSHQTACAIHVLVAAAFIGPRPPGTVVRHLDGNHHNNASHNLVYGTHKENEADKYRHGRRGPAEMESNAVLTREQVREIRLLGPYDSQRVLAEHYGVDRTLISLILRAKIWRDGPSGKPKWLGDGMYEKPIPQAKSWNELYPLRNKGNRKNPFKSGGCIEY